MPRRTLAGYDTHLTTFGNGPRKALLLHCSLGHSGAYAKLGAALGGALTTTCFDQPGHGRTEDWRSDRDLQDVVTDMASELLTEPVDLIGHSFGGTVALRLAVDRPDLVRSLTLIEPVMMAIAKADDPRIEDMLRTDMRGFNEAFDAGDLETASRNFVGRYGDGREWSALSPEGRAYIIDRIHLIRAGGRAVNQDYYGLIDKGLLDSISAPTLVIDGGEGGPAMDGVCAGLERRLKNATRVKIAGGGHMVPLTRPDAVAREILAMLSLPQVQ